MHVPFDAATIMHKDMLRFRIIVLETRNEL